MDNLELTTKLNNIDEQIKKLQEERTRIIIIYNREHKKKNG